MKLNLLMLQFDKKYSTCHTSPETSLRKIELLRQFANGQCRGLILGSKTIFGPRQVDCRGVTYFLCFLIQLTLSIFFSQISSFKTIAPLKKLGSGSLPRTRSDAKYDY